MCATRVVWEPGLGGAGVAEVHAPSEAESAGPCTCAARPQLTWTTRSISSPRSLLRSLALASRFSILRMFLNANLPFSLVRSFSVARLGRVARKQRERGRESWGEIV